MRKLAVVVADPKPKRMPLRWEAIRLLRAVEDCGELPPAAAEAAAELREAIWDTRRRQP